MPKPTPFFDDHRLTDAPWAPGGGWTAGSPLTPWRKRAAARPGASA